MILSSANILEILQGSAVIRLAAGEIKVVEKKPIASGREGFYVYIEKYPTLEEFEAIWRVWIESDGSEPDDLLLAEMRRLLPNFEFKLGLVIEATVRDFKSDKTEVRPKPSQAPVVMPPSGWMSGIEKRFEELVEDIQDRMLLVNSGKPGKDGQRGPEGPPGARGRDGRDGKDLLATSAMLNDLIDVEIADRIPLKKGQVLTYNGANWENLYVPQIQALSGGGSASTTPVASTGTAIQWKYHGSSNEVEPQSRHFHTDTTDTDAVSVFHVSKTNNAGNDVELLLDELLRTATRVYVSQVADPSLAHLFQIDGYTETTTGYEINVTHIETAGPEVDFEFSKVYEFLFLGQDGTGGGATSIDDLTDVDTSTSAPLPGQTLVWNGTDWVPGNFASGGGISDAPADGNYYVRYNGTWVNLIEAINMINLLTDGGNFTLGQADTVDRYIYDGGDFINNTSDTGEQVPPAEGYEELDGGDFS